MCAGGQGLWCKNSGFMGLKFCEIVGFCSDLHVMLPRMMICGFRLEKNDRVFVRRMFLK
jgi:hypothetical protein